MSGLSSRDREPHSDHKGLRRCRGSSLGRVRCLISVNFYLVDGFGLVFVVVCLENVDFRIRLFKVEHQE